MPCQGDTVLVKWSTGHSGHLPSPEGDLNREVPLYNDFQNDCFTRHCDITCITIVVLASVRLKIKYINLYIIFF